MVVKEIDLQTTTLTLDELLAELDANTEIILMRGDAPIARIARVRPSTDPQVKKRVMGLHRGQGWMSDDFTAELPDSFWIGEDE